MINETYQSQLLTPCCRVLLKKLTGLQLVKKFPEFHGTRMFITELTSLRHLSLSWASPIQSIYPHPISWKSILILSTHLRLGLPSGLYPSGFPTKTLYAPLSSPMRATCPAHLILWHAYLLFIPIIFKSSSVSSLHLLRGLPSFFVSSTVAVLDMSPKVKIKVSFWKYNVDLKATLIV